MAQLYLLLLFQSCLSNEGFAICPPVVRYSNFKALLGHAIGLLRNACCLKDYNIPLSQNIVFAFRLATDMPKSISPELDV